MVSQEVNPNLNGWRMVSFNWKFGEESARIPDMGQVLQCNCPSIEDVTPVQEWASQLGSPDCMSLLPVIGDKGTRQALYAVPANALNLAPTGIGALWKGSTAIDNIALRYPWGMVISALLQGKGPVGAMSLGDFLARKFPLGENVVTLVNKVRSRSLEQADLNKVLYVLIAWSLGRSERLDEEEVGFLRKAGLPFSLTEQERTHLLLLWSSLAEVNHIYEALVVAFDGLDAPSVKASLKPWTDSLIEFLSVVKIWEGYCSVGVMLGFEDHPLDTFQSTPLEDLIKRSMGYLRVV